MKLQYSGLGYNLRCDVFTSGLEIRECLHLEGFNVLWEGTSPGLMASVHVFCLTHTSFSHTAWLSLSVRGCYWILTDRLGATGVKLAVVIGPGLPV